MQCVDDHRGRFVRVPAEERGGERKERDEEQLQDVEEERGPIYAAEVAEVDGAPDPVRAEHRESEREAEEIRGDRRQAFNELSGGMRIGYVQLEDEKCHPDRLTAAGRAFQQAVAV